ncbi:hypothetical protein [Gluconobacter sp. DsW_056]|uniref:hypothetical protein n=1 Tax=Gluconobacter sp. DsW_056 TaxID=1511209 RepID=UPI00117A57B9|nr:hypothetical protein [Gluconobacter sp. DsW_056]
MPQFYMRRFALLEDTNKLMVVERHGDILNFTRKSVGSIGYEKRLHDFVENGGTKSIESEVNKLVEMPFAESPTWKKIVNGECASLDAVDGLSIYGFARHLLRRNVKMLRFMQAEHAQYRAGNLFELTAEEREMHQRIAQAPGGPHQMFRANVLDTSMPDDAHAINVMVCQSPTPFRSSTNPTLSISEPGRDSIFGEMFNSLRTWWLSLNRYFGAFIIAGGSPGFSNLGVQPEIARVVNRRFLVQLLHGDARYMLADDEHIENDLEWAGFKFDKNTTHGFRYRADGWVDPNPDTRRAVGRQWRS